MKLYVLVGMIASGKSTYSRNAAQSGILCVNDDAIVNMLHADDYTLYDKNLKVLYKTIENQIIGTALAMDRAVLMDRGLNVSVNGRKRWIALAKSFDVPVEAICFPKEDSVETHAWRRLNSDARGHSYDYWLSVALAHAKLYTEPTTQEGFDKVHHISFDEVLKGTVIL